MMLKYYIENANKDDLYEKLEKDYPHILHAMKDENYHIEYPHYGFIKEIKHDDKVVGILVLQKLKEVTLRYALSELYIHPDYRSDEILMNEIINLISTQNMELYIRKPSKKLVKTLIKYNIAVKLEKNIVITPIPFICDCDDIYENKKLKKYYDEIKDKNEEYMHVSHYYHLKYGSMLFSKDPLYVPANDEMLMITTPNKNDMNGSLKKNLRKITSSDLMETNLFICLFDELEIEVQKNYNLMLDSLLTVDNIVGSKYELNDNTKSLLEENNLTEADGFRIRSEIVEALNSHEITNKTISSRLRYLISGEILPPSAYELALNCPHCNNPIDYYSLQCIICGHDLKNEKLFRSVKEITNRELDGMDFEVLGDDELQVNAIFTNKLIDRITQNDYDTEEVIKSQGLYITYHHIKSLKKDLHMNEGEDIARKVKEGSGLIYAINQGYIEELSEKTYRETLEGWDSKQIKLELEGYGIEAESDDKESLISQIFSDEYFERFIDERFVPTEKGLKLLDCDLINYYEENIDKDYLFYEFHMLWNENIDKLTPDEIKEKLIEECEKI